MPVKQEFHAKEFVVDKDPYHGLYDHEVRRAIIFEYCNFLGSLTDVRVVTVAIDKTKIKRPKYNVLKNALTYNVQRIENDLTLLGASAKFIIITDDGRTAAMRNITRQIQRINYIPSKFGPQSYRKEIKTLIEDPLPKSSDQSYFIQLVDLVAFVVSLYIRNQRNPSTPWGKRLLQVLQPGDELTLLHALKPVLNTKATRANEFGVVVYPK